MWIGTLPPKPASNSVTALAFSPDGRTLYTGDQAGFVLAWDLAKRASRELMRLPDEGATGRSVSQLLPTPDGGHLFVEDHGRLMDALAPGDGAVLDSGNGNYGCAWSLVPGRRQVMGYSYGNQLTLWDLDKRAKLKVPGPLANKQGIWFKQLLSDGKTLLTYRRGKKEAEVLQLWAFGTGKLIGNLSPSPTDLYPCDVSPDASAVAVVRQGQLWVYDIPSRTLRVKNKAKDFGVVVFHPGGRLLAAANKSGVRLLDAGTLDVVREHDWNIGRCRAVAFSPDGLTCAVGGSKKQFAVFDVDL